MCCSHHGRPVSGGNILPANEASQGQQWLADSSSSNHKVYSRVHISGLARNIYSGFIGLLTRVVKTELYGAGRLEPCSTYVFIISRSLRVVLFSGATPSSFFLIHSLQHCSSALLWWLLGSFVCKGGCGKWTPVLWTISETITLFSCLVRLSPPSTSKCITTNSGLTSPSKYTPSIPRPAVNAKLIESTWYGAGLWQMAALPGLCHLVIAYTSNGNFRW